MKNLLVYTVSFSIFFGRPVRPAVKHMSGAKSISQEALSGAFGGFGPLLIQVRGMCEGQGQWSP